MPTDMTARLHASQCAPGMRGEPSTLRAEDGEHALPTLRARNMWGSNVRAAASDEWIVRASLCDTMSAIRRQTGFDTWHEARAAGYDAIPVTVIEGHHSPGALVKDGVEQAIAPSVRTAPPTRPTTRALLEAHDPALLKALVEWHDNPERYDAYLRLCLLIRGALIPPPAPQVTDARACIPSEWWV
jgi:hypothetical protein